MFGHYAAPDRAELWLLVQALHGPLGRVRFRLQYSYINRDTFTEVGGALIAYENMLDTSFRYDPV